MYKQASVCLLKYVITLQMYSLFMTFQNKKLFFYQKGNPSSFSCPCTWFAYTVCCVCAGCACC